MIFMQVFRECTAPMIIVPITPKWSKIFKTQNYKISELREVEFS